MTEDFNPLVSIVIPVYNGENYMREAIDSALGQTYKNIEVIVVNDGSKDRSDEIARSYGNKIRYFKKENGGVSTALNLAIKNMKGEYFSWLSHDDVYLPEKIECQIEVLRHLEDKTTVINCNNMRINGYGELIAYRIYVIPKKYRDKPLYYFFTSQISGCGLLLHKSYFEKLGDFDTSLRIAQDYAMWFKIFRQRDTHIYHIDKSLMKMREHPAQVTNTSNIYLTESDDFWSGTLKQITDEEIRFTFADALSFYFLLRRFISPESPKTGKIVYRSYCTALKEGNKKEFLLFQKLPMMMRYYVARKSMDLYNILMLPWRCLKKYKSLLILFSNKIENLFREI